MKSNNSILVKNKEIIPICFTNTAELLSKYSGTYSTCRTFDKFKIVDLPTHIDRLTKVGLTNPNQTQPLSFQKTYEKVIPAIRQVIQHLQEIFEQDQLDVETRLTVVLSYNSLSEMNYDVVVFGEAQPLPSKPPIIIAIHQGQRKNPEIKHTQWSQDRTVFTNLKKSDEEEIVLQGFDSPNLYEGLSSNFGIIKNGMIYTSPKGTVLEGVTLDLILKCCDEANIPVKREFPNIEEISSWEGAFVSSSSRLLLQVTQIRMGNKEIEIPKSPILDMLSLSLIEQMRKNAIDINSTWEQVLDHMQTNEE